MTIHLRPASPSDAAAIAEIFLAARARCMPYLPRVHSDDETRKWIAEHLSRQPDLWVAEVDGRVRGFAAVRGDHLDHLYVHPDAHGAGIGSALLDKVKNLRPEGFRLWVFQRNVSARQFYMRHGLKLVRETDGRDNEERAPDAEYLWPGDSKDCATEIARAVEILRDGRVVAFPTETVYGLGADATNADAVARVFALKGRPSTNPLICHVADESVARRYARDWPDAATKLAERFWPGPLTIVLAKTQAIVDAVTAGKGTVGLRVPNHPVAMKLLRAFGGPLAGPSANRSSHVSPTIARHVRDEFGDAVDLILDGGACTIGIESTVLDLSGGTPRILRPGGVSREEIEAVIGKVEMKTMLAEASTPVDSPGQFARHYAPRTPAFRFDPKDRHSLPMTEAAVIELTLDPQGYARNFYARLRLLDTQSLRAIYIEMPPDLPDWVAVRDRIFRATEPLA